MPFLGRHPDGSVYGIWTVRQWPGQEEVEDAHPDVVAFTRPRPVRDSADSENLDKAGKALLLCLAQVGGLTPVQMKALFRAKHETLP